MSVTGFLRKSLRAKILLGYMIIIGVLMMAGLWVILSTLAIDRAVEAITIDSYKSLAAVHAMLNSLDELSMAQSRMMIDSESQGIDQVYMKVDRSFRGSLSTAQGNITYPGEREALQEISAQYDSFMRSVLRISTLMQVGSSAEAVAEYSAVTATYSKITAALEDLYSINNEYMVKSTDNAKEKAAGAISSIVLVSIAGLVIALYLGVTVSNIIIRPTMLLTESARKVAQGELGIIASVGSEDEIGMLANEFNAMTGKLKEYEEANIDRLVTEQRKSEAIIGSIADPIIVLDKGMRCLRINQAAQSVFGQSQEEALGKHVLELIDSRIALEAAQKCLEHNRVLSFSGTDRIIELPDGEKRKYYRIEAAPFEDVGAKAQGVILYLADVTYFKEVDKLKTDFVSTASHEFRTPLASMVMASELLLEEKAGALSDKQRRLTQIIREDCARLQELVSELLDISKLESGRMDFNMKAVKLENAFSSSAFSLLPLFKDKGVELIIDDSSAMPAVYADPKKLPIVIGNLLSNALRYTDAGGSVRIGSEDLGDSVRISITDTGIGIPENLQSRVFERFFQMKGDDRHSAGGAGLGLALVKETVEAMGGGVELRSKQGEGSEFSFTLRKASEHDKDAGIRP